MVHKRIIVLLYLFITFSVFATNKYAIIVGVNDYEILTDLKAGVNDAKIMASYYKALGFKVWLMSDIQDSKFEKPSLSNIDRVLNNIKDLSEDQKIDELVIFFAGHGVQIEGNNYLCFPETDVSNNSGMLSVDQTLVPWIRDLNAKLSMVYLDACRNDLGPMRAAGVERGIEVKGIEHSEGGGDLAIFYAAKPGSFSYEKPDGSNGFFTDTLIEAFQSSTTNSIGELYSYLRTALPERTEGAYGRPQIPHLGGDFDLTVGYTKGNVDLGAIDTSAKLYVESSIPNATVTIDGVKRGVTPLIVNGLNSGNILVEVEIDGFYASKEVEIQAKSFNELSLELIKVTGHLFISSVKAMDKEYNEKLSVWIDGDYKGEYNKGLIPSINPGGRDIIIKGNGLYWEDRVTIQPRNHKNISINLEPVGNLVINSNPQVAIKLIHENSGYEILLDESEGETMVDDLPIGAWKVSLKKSGFIEGIENIEISKGETKTLNRLLEMNKNYAMTTQLASLKAENIVLTKTFEVSKKSNTKNLLSRGVGSVLLGITGYLAYSSYNSYLEYQDTASTSNANSKREQITLNFNIGIGTLVGGMVGFILPVFSTGPNYSKSKAILRSNQLEIEKLEAELKLIGKVEE